jgi:hypothetical protein
MNPVSYEAKVTYTLRQLAALLVGVLGALLILYAGTALLQDPAAEADPGVSLLLVAASIILVGLAFMSQSARARWTLSKQGIEERIAPRFAWLPFGPRSVRTISASQISGWRRDEIGVRAERRPVIVFEVRGQKALNIRCQHREADAAFEEIVRVAELWLK